MLYSSWTAKTMQSRSKESRPRSSTRRVSRRTGASGGVWVLDRTISASWARCIGSVMVPPTKDESVVGAPESERRAEDDLERGRPGPVRDVVEVEFRVGEVIDGGR